MGSLVFSENVGSRRLVDRIDLGLDMRIYK